MPLSWPSIDSPKRTNRKRGIVLTAPLIPRTEQRNPFTLDIDTWSAEDIVRHMNAEDHKVAPAVSRYVPAIAKAAQMVAQALDLGGTIYYVGAGTSGRLGVLDVSELLPTFGAIGERFVAVMCGGDEAVTRSVETAEDGRDDGAREIALRNVGPKDVVVGIAASGNTPFVCGALEEARRRGAKTVAVVGDPQGDAAKESSVVIAPDLGPEVLTGSTRMKNGTAQKLILNAVSTTAMILTGHTHSNLLVGMVPTNAKLKVRARGIVKEITGQGETEAQRALEESQYNIRSAIQSLGGATKHARKSPSQWPRIGEATEAGLDPQKVERAFTVVEEAIGDGSGQIPGAVATILRQGVMLMPRAFGYLSRRPEQVPMEPGTTFDLASLTKVTATLPSVLRLLEEGAFRLDDPLCLFIPEFGARGKENVTIRELLTHTSGLRAHRRFYEEGLKGQEIPQAICDMELMSGFRRGQKVVYSDLGFIMLGELVARITGCDLGSYTTQNVFRPLGMDGATWNPGTGLRDGIAATEYREDLGKVTWGEVHDENAYSMGGIAGHAGLFATAVDIAKYASSWLPSGHPSGSCAGDSSQSSSQTSGTISTKKRILSESTIRLATTRHTSEEEPRGLGWQLVSPRLSSAGDLMGKHSFGHTGFTGTSLWCDPDRDMAVILLTNRVHAGRDGNDHIRLRARFANAAMAALEGGSYGGGE